MIITNKGLIKKNDYIKISESEEIKIHSKISFNLDFWLLNKEKIISSNKEMGIIINQNDKLKDILSDLFKFDLIDFTFSTFKDGRAFSYARKLRELGFINDIKASGHILPDQFIFLLRCGFSIFEIKPEQKETWINALNKDSGLYYQPNWLKKK